MRLEGRLHLSSSKGGGRHHGYHGHHVIEPSLNRSANLGSAEELIDEFGLPSLRAFSATALPLCLLVGLLSKLEMDMANNVSAPWPMTSWSLAAGGVAVMGIWVLAVSLSRIYLGANSPADVIAGALLGVAMVVSWECWVGDVVDVMLVSRPEYALTVMALAPIAGLILLIGYPIPFTFMKSFPVRTFDDRI